MNVVQTANEQRRVKRQCTTLEWLVLITHPNLTVAVILQLSFAS